MASVTINQKVVAPSISRAQHYDYGILFPSTKSYPIATVSEVLPFRIRFENIGIKAFGPNSPAPIGIAIVGFNNYIL